VVVLDVHVVEDPDRELDGRHHEEQASDGAFLSGRTEQFVLTSLSWRRVEQEPFPEP
jgi:hypothetical protein